MIRRPPRSTRTDTLFPTRRSSDLSVTRPALPLGTSQTARRRLRSKPASSLIPRGGLGETLVQAYCRAPGNAISEQSGPAHPIGRSEEHTSELQSLMRISYAVFCLKKKKTQ